MKMFVYGYGVAVDDCLAIFKSTTNKSEETKK